MTPERLFSYINPNVAKVEDAADIIEKINQRGIPVLLVEQKVTFALKMSHRPYVMENGRVVMSAPGEELLDHEHVRRAYLSV